MRIIVEAWGIELGLFSPQAPSLVTRPRPYQTQRWYWEETLSESHGP